MEEDNLNHYILVDSLGNRVADIEGNLKLYDRPKYHAGEKVRYKGQNHEIGEIVKYWGDEDPGRYSVRFGKEYHNISESMLEPYTGPKEDHIVQDHEMVDAIIKDGFRNHNRLHVASILMAGLLAYGKASANFSVPNADDYPSFSVNDDESTTLTVPAAWISSCIAIGQDFVMDDNLRPQLCAIYCHVKDGRFGFCATDTRSLATDSWEMPGCDVDGAFLMMKNVFGPLRMMCAKNDSGVAVTFNDKHVTYRCGDTIIQSVQASGRYPDFNRVIPKTHNIECKVLKKDLIEPLLRVAMFCEVSKCVQFAFGPFDVTMTVENMTDGKRSVEPADVTECTGELTIGINADNIIKCLKAYDSSDIVMEMTDAGRPIVVRSEDKPNMTVLSMPMQIV